MYIAITKQQMGGNYNQSVSDYVAYLEKENAEKDILSKEYFFNQFDDAIAPETVIKEIDNNTAKLKKSEPKFYSLIVSPSRSELKAIGNNPQKLKAYVNSLMNDYAKAFYRATPVNRNDIKYFAKVEYERTYRGFEKEIKANAPYRKEIIKLENDLRKIARGEIQGNPKAVAAKIAALKNKTPYKIDGELIKEGMQKQGVQTHVHIIVSRKDASNTYSLSPGAAYKASKTTFNGKEVYRGFNRVQFMEAAEKTFDRLSGYQRNFVETFNAKKMLKQNPKDFYIKLLGLPTNERATAFKLLSKSGVQIPNIPTNQIQLAQKAIKKLKRSIQLARDTASIGI